jgi:hypothetical protein
VQAIKGAAHSVEHFFILRYPRRRAQPGYIEGFAGGDKSDE